MPSSAQMLDQLAHAVARARPISMGWHLVLAVVLVAMSAGWIPSGRAAGAMLAALCASVAVVSMTSGNPFNAIVFGALAAAFIATSWGDRSPVAPHATVVSAAALVLGWTYPHFADFPVWLWASPVGVVPCATLYVLGGATLSGFGPRSAAVRWIVAIAALFYGAVGLFVLRVWIDAGLLLVHAACIREAHAYSRALHRARDRGLRRRQDVDAAGGLRAKFDDQRANRST